MPVVPGLWIVSYDIANPRRLQRVARLLEKTGLRLQYSVFAVREETRSVNELKAALAQVIKPSEDDVRIYPISARGRSLMLGATMLASDLLPYHPVFQQLRLPLNLSHTCRREKSEKNLAVRAKCRSDSERVSLWIPDW